MSANLLWIFFVKTPTKRHPERSASQIYGVNTALVGAESKDPEGAYLTHVAQSFSTTETRVLQYARYAVLVFSRRISSP